jgi:hypothetical protein
MIVGYSKIMMWNECYHLYTWSSDDDFRLSEKDRKAGTPGYGTLQGGCLAAIRSRKVKLLPRFAKTCSEKGRRSPYHMARLVVRHLNIL